MIGIIKKTITKIKHSMFPSEHDKEVQRWFADGGDEKFRYDYDLNGDSLVIDLGGYKGQWASDIFARYNCHVLVFEPVSSFAVKIEERFKNNPKIEVFRVALGAKKRQDVIALAEDGSSVYGDTLKKELIQVEDVSNFFAVHNVETVDLMKVNIEGGEYELLQRLLAAGLIMKIKNLQIQFHNIEVDSEIRMLGIFSELSKTHRPTYRYKFVWENWVRREI